MATLASNRNIHSRIGQLPAIQHPGLRHAKGELEIHGSSSRDGTIKASLPPLRTEDNAISYIKLRRHSRGSTWPVDQEKTDSRNGQHFVTLTQRKSIEELEDLIYEKLSGSFSGIRQAFKANDSQGKGTISREAFKNILYHLCGYVSTAQFNGLLQRFGLESRNTVAFDDFIRHFKDNEVVEKEWVDPVVRPTLTPTNLPSNKLKIVQRQRAAVKEPITTRSLPKMYNALQVFPMLKRKVKENFLDFAKLFPTSCFDLDGSVLKPQLRQALHMLNVHMYDDEFDKVWDRFDRSGIGTVASHIFFKVLGLKRLEIEPSDIPNDVFEDVPMTPVLSLPRQGDVTPADDVVSVKEKTPTPEKEETKEIEGVQGDVLKILQARFRQGYNSILRLFTAFDPNDTGTITRGEFRHVLSKCRLNLGPVEVEHFLSRFGVRDEEKVHYRDILNSLEDRTERGLLQKILQDKAHRFNRSRESDAGYTSAVDAEAKLLDIIHSDFLSLLAAFKQFDRESLGVIKKYQFQELLNARFGIQLTRKQTVELLKRTGAEESDGLVSYGKFLENFTSQRSSIIDQQREKTPPSHHQTPRPSTTPVRSPRPPSNRPATVRPPTEEAPRDSDQLLAEIGNLVTDKYDVIKKTFIGIDNSSRNCGNLTRETFRKLFERHNLKMTATEVDNLWKKLPVERDGTLNFIELVKICFSKADKAAPNGEQDKIEHGVLSRVLQNYARTHVRDSLDKFLEEDEDQHYVEEVTMETILEEKPADQDINMNNKPQSTSAKIEDIILKIKNEVRSNFTQLQEDLRQACKDNNSTIDAAVFSEILLKYCKTLSNTECNKLCHRFEKGHKGSIRCKEFMKVFVPTMPEGTDPIASRCHSRHDRSKTYPVMDGVSSDALSVVMYKMKNKMICEWKALRRAMKRCDHHDNGMISIADFKANLREFGFDLSDEDFFHILSEFDINMDGRISYVAFMKQAVL